MERLKGAYRYVAILFLNTVVAFALLNIGIGVIFAGQALFTVFGGHAGGPSGKLFNAGGSPVDNGRRSPPQLQKFDYNACRELEPSYVADVLDDFFELRQQGLIYQPWVQFSERPFQGKRVSVRVDELGIPYRGTVNPLDHWQGNVVRIYTFGGSTTFGYNVSDEHTWPSHLSRILNERARQESLDTRVEVRNYGRGFYYPSQEVALPLDLLRSGHRPSLVVFLDGLNVGFLQDVPHFSAKVDQALRNMQHPVADWPKIKSLALPWLPVWRVAKLIRQAPATDDTEESEQVEEESPEQMREMAAMLARRFQENRKLVGRVAGLYGVETLLVIQPNALVNYPLELYRTPRTSRFLRARMLAGSLYEKLQAQDGTVFLGNLFEEWGLERRALIDNVHYSPAFNQFLAQRISSHIRLSRLNRSASAAVDPSNVTGASRVNGFARRSPLL